MGKGLISRQAAINALYEYWSGCSFEGSGQYIADKSEDVLNDLPSVPRKGKWIEHDDYLGDVFMYVLRAKNHLF